MDGWEAFLVGLSRAWRSRQLLLALLVVHLVAAIVVAGPAALSLVGPARRPAMREASDGIDAWFVVEAFVSPDVGDDEGGGGADATVRRTGLVGTATLGLLLMLAWLSKALLSGGVLAIYASDDRFGWRRFVQGCRDWFGTFLLLGPVEAIATVLALFPVLVLVVVGVAAVGGWLGWVVVLVLGGGGLVWWATMEMAYVVAVAGGKRSVFGALGRAAGFVIGQPLAVVGLYGPAMLIWALLTALCRWGLRPRIGPGAWVSLFVVQQAFIMVRLLVRLARLAGSVTLYEARSHPPGC
jgi:hypothetical protein